MKKRFALILAVLSFAAVHAFAQCPTHWSGPTGVSGSGGGGWYDYTQDRSCYTLSGNTSQDTTSCGDLGWRFDFGWTDIAATSFAVDASTPMFNPNHWSASVTVELISPDATFYDSVRLYAEVRHPNGTLNTYTLYSANGTQGTLNPCWPRGSGYFAANVGDVITIRVRASNLGTGSTVRTGTPHIFNQT